MDRHRHRLTHRQLGILRRPAQPVRLWPVVLAALLALVAVVITPGPALAATRTWSGLGGDANWMTSGNWIGGVAPVPGDDLVFPAGAMQLTNTNNFPAGTLFNSLTIQGTGYTLNGNLVTLAADQSITATHPAGTTSTINLPISGNGDVHVYVSYGAFIPNPVARLVFGGSLSSVGHFVNHGAGTTVLLAPGTTSLGWIINGGVVNIQNAGALGSGPVDLEGGALQLQGGITLPNALSVRGASSGIGATGAVESVSGNNTLTGGITLFAMSQGNYTLQTAMSADAGASLTVSTNPITFATFQVLFLNISGTGTITISSPIQGAGGLLKGSSLESESGLLTLSGANTYDGQTNARTGPVLVTGNQPSRPIFVNRGATLRGTGTTGSISVYGTLSPGVSGPGIFHSGAVYFYDTSIYAVELNGATAGSGYDQLDVAGPSPSVDLTSGPTLNVTVGFPSALGNTFTIIQSAGPITGLFSGLPNGGR